LSMRSQWTPGGGGIARARSNLLDNGPSYVHVLLTNE
jgi:hypothetical protein